MTTAAPDGSPPPCYSCGSAIGTPQNVPTFPGAMFGECVACGAGLMAFKDAAGAVVYSRAGGIPVTPAAIVAPATEGA